MILLLFTPDASGGGSTGSPVRGSRNGFGTRRRDDDEEALALLISALPPGWEVRRN